MKAIEVAFPKPCGEDWEAMTPSGCNRHCAVCDKVIKDLEHMTSDEAVALLASGEEVCVRAKVQSDGSIRLKDIPANKPSFKRIATGAAASLGLAACAGAGSTEESGLKVSGVLSQPAAHGLLHLQRSGEKVERKPGPRPKTAGRTQHPILVTNPDANGEYSFEGLERGRYTLSWSNCFGQVELTRIELTESNLRLPNLTAPTETDAYDCEVIVGVMIRSDTRSRRP